MATLAILLVPAAAAAKPASHPNAVDVQLLAINDFHGNLEPPGGSGGRVGVAANDGACIAAAPNCYLAGGLAYLADDIKNLEATNPNTLVVSAGDNIGATPLLSAAFHDEPTIEGLNLIGLDVSAVGNHEFDEGVDELLRIQNGGCHPVDGCQTGHDYEGADFQFLAANVVYKDTGEPILPAYSIKEVGGVKVGFIGLTLEGTASIVSASGIQDVDFLDEATTINSAAQALRTQGVRTIVVLIHQGGAQSVAISPTSINTCTGVAGPIVDIVHNLAPSVDMVISGHTHQAYNCMLPNRGDQMIPVTSAASFGRLVTDVDMTLNSKSGKPMSIAVNNTIVYRDDMDSDAEDLVDYYKTAIAPVANQVVGEITADITRTTNTAGESALGDVIADAQLAETAPAGSGDAVVAMMNPGGIRADLNYASSPAGEGDGNVTFGEAFTVQPFTNYLVTMTLTGAQIEAVLEQQFCNPDSSSMRVLQVSDGFSYSWSQGAACGSKVDPASIMLNGSAVDPGANYRVTVNSFLADGGDGFTVLADGTDRLVGAIDVDAFVAYLGANSPVAPGPQNRITALP